MTKSPCTLTEEQLTITEEDLAAFGEEEQEQELAFDDEADVVNGGRSVANE